MSAFILIRIDEGGASDFSFEGFPHLCGWLRAEGRGFWDKDIDALRARTWQPGDWISFSCGWIFCVNKLLEQVDVAIKEATPAQDLGREHDRTVRKAARGTGGARRTIPSSSKELCSIPEGPEPADCARVTDPGLAADIAEKVVTLMLVDKAVERANYDSEFLTDRYAIAACVGAALREIAVRRVDK